MNKKQLFAGLCLLSVAVGLKAYTGLELAPNPSVDNSYRLARQIEAGQRNSSIKESFGGRAGKVSKASANGPKIYGMMQYSDSWYDLPEGSSYPYGCYEISKENPTPFEMYAHPNLMANGGGCYTDHQVHYRIWELLPEEPWFNNYYMVVNTDYWSYVQNPRLSNEQTTIANDMTYDPVTKNIYAAVWGNYDGGNTRFATVDKTTGATSEIATLPDMACLVANNFGELYGVELLTGMTYRIDKATGKYVALGLSGLSPKYLQSACVDPETNVIYWLATLSDYTAGVYTLNTTTGKADLYFDLPDNAEFTCAFIEAPVKGLGAPAALINFKVVATGEGSKVSLTAPVSAFDGTAPGNMTVKVYADGTEVYSKSLAAGASDEFTCTPGDGNHTFVAYAVNSVGEGEKTVVDHFTGNDAPAAPSNIRLLVTDNVASLSWDAPEAGLKGGTIEADKLVYNVTRFPGGEMVAEGIKATTFTETLPEGLANYYYSVTSIIGETVGGTANSNSWFAGSAYDVPYLETFDTEDSMRGFITLDGDGDGASWEYSGHWKAAWSKYNKYEQSDNWLITPPIRFAANSTYRLSFRACAFDEDSPERFEVKMGKTPTVEGMTETLVSSTVTNNTSFVTYTADFTTDAEGILYFGFHTISPANAYRLIVDDIEIRLKAAAGVPAAVSDLKATAAADGSGKVTLSFTTPDKTMDGQKLDELSKVEILRGAGPVVKAFDNPTPGQALEWTDESAPSGDVEYTVVAYNSVGRGIEANATAFVGFDKPLPATGLKLSINDEEQILFEWKAPTKTVNGNDINPEYLTYTIFRNDGSKMAEGLKTPYMVDKTLPLAGDQVMVYYQVTANYGDKESDVAIADYILIGDPLSVPFKESFRDKGLDNLPWVISRVSGHTDMRWSLQSQATTPDATAQDGDGGFASFVAYGQQGGLMERMTSPMIDLFSADHPVLKFYLYLTKADSQETLAVQISNNDHQFATLKEFSIKSDKEGWTEMSVEIPRKYCTETAMISFLGTSARGFNIHIDNIRIEDGDVSLPDYDLEAVRLDVPDMHPDEVAKVILNVYNNGTKAIGKYSVALLMNDVEIIKSDADKAIEPGETYQYIFKLTPEQSDLDQTFRFKGRIKCDVDQNADNNETDEVAVTVGVSGLSEVDIDDATEVSVYTLDGVCILNAVPASELKSLDKGLYIVRRGNKTFKLSI